MAELCTRYLGLQLANPVVASASPLTRDVGAVRALEDAGTAAVVMTSLFEEQVTHESLALDHFLLRGSDSFSEALDFFPDLGRYNLGTDGYLEQVAALKRAVDIPIVGSLNGVSAGGWIEHAALIEQAGADALELNIYFVPTDARLTASDLEDVYAALVREVRAQTRLPLAVKLSPHFTALPNFATRLAESGADALVLFNRFYQPDLDIEQLEVVTNLELSTPGELRLRLRWLAILSAQLDIDFAASGGVASSEGVLKAIMSGATVAMMTSELLRRGAGRVSEILADLELWLDEHEVRTLDVVRGSMNHRAVSHPAAFERANYMKVLGSYDGRRP